MGTEYYRTDFSNTACFFLIFPALSEGSVNPTPPPHLVKTSKGLSHFISLLPNRGGGRLTEPLVNMDMIIIIKVSNGSIIKSQSSYTRLLL